MPDSAIRKYELGVLQPKLETLQRIASALDIAVYSLLGDERQYALEPTTRDCENDEWAHPHAVLLKRLAVMLEGLDSSDKAEKLLINLTATLDAARKLKGGKIEAVSRLADLIQGYTSMMLKSLSLCPDKDACSSFLDSYNKCIGYINIHLMNLSVGSQSSGDDQIELNRLLKLESLYYYKGLSIDEDGDTP